MKRQKWTKVLMVVLASVLVVALGSLAAYQAFRSWRQNRILSSARIFIEQGEFRKAALSLERAISLDKQDIEAVRLMAVLAEAGRSRAALVWRHRAVEIEPSSTDDRLALAHSALVLQDLESAESALAGVRVTDPPDPNYLSLRGGLDLALGRIPSARSNFARAAERDPQNPMFRLNLAVLQLQSTNESDRVAGRGALDQVLSSGTNAEVRCRALREMVRDAVRRGDEAAMDATTSRLVGEKGSRFSDQLMRLDFVRARRSAEFGEALAQVRARSTNSPFSMSEMVLWEMGRVPATATLGWVQGLPPSIQTNSAVSMVSSDLRVALKDWAGIESSLRGQNWGELDFLRLAYRAMALRREGLIAGAESEWAQAMKLASQDKGRLMVLLKTIAEWRWPEETREVLATLIGRHPSEQWALDLLLSNLVAEGRSAALLSVLRQQVALRPSDLRLKNNLAMVALLLEAREVRGHELAKEVYEAEPGNADYASTHAFSLHVLKKDAEALQVIEKLPPQALESKGIAGYYALILKANGQGAKARRYFDIALGSRLLPEEKRLFQRALSGG